MSTVPIQEAPAQTPTPAPFSSFTASAPLPMPEPIKEEPPLEESLTYEEDIDPSSSDLSPEQEQELLDPSQAQDTEVPALRPPTPSEEDIKEVAMFAPSDLRQYDYAINRRSGIISRYSKGPDPAKPLTASLVVQDLPKPEPTNPPPTKVAKIQSVKVWPKKDSGHTLLYHPDKPEDDDAAPSME